MSRENPLVVMVSESPPTVIYRCGVGVVIETLIDILNKAGWQTKWIYPGYKQRQGVEDEATLFSFKTPKQKVYRDAWFLWTPMGLANLVMVLWWFWRWKPDLVVSHGTHQAPQIVVVGAKILGIPVLLQEHIFDEFYIEEKFPRYAKGFVKRYQNWMNRMMARLAELVRCPSKWFARRFQETSGFIGKIDIDASLIAQNAPVCDKADVARQFRAENKIPAEAKIIMCLGRVCPEKNVEFLLRVLVGIRDSLPKSGIEVKPVLVLVGGGPQEYIDYLWELVREIGLEDRFRILGEYGHSDGLAWMQIADLIWLPSKSETQGLVAGEAMQVAVVLVMAEYAMAEIVMDSECTLPDDLLAWVEKSNTILTDDELAQRIRERLRILSTKHTNADKFSQELLEGYRKLFRT